MSIPATYSFTRYLAAKKSVDDRALNQHVRQRLTRAVPRATPAAPLQVLEVGAGIGTMVERLVTWGLLTNAIYTAIDADAETLAEIHRRLPPWMAERGFSMREETPERRRFQRRGQDLIVAVEALDLLNFSARERGHRVWDLLIAHAFLDIVDIPTALASLFPLLRPGGLFYFTMVFDGDTVLQPEIDPAFDAQIETLYHQTMDHCLITTQPAGGSQTGRHLFGHLRAAGAELLDVGSSDWVVFSGPHGYPTEEDYFLHCIIHTIHTALEGHPQLDAGRFKAWIEQRHAQVEQGTLVYIAHQLDFLGRVPPSTADA
jgi:SAM-dependent methyltransferase